MKPTQTNGWRPGICYWCKEVMLVTTLARTKRREFCGPCLTKLAKATDSTDFVAQVGDRLA